jgi:hypothetical protein
VPTPTFWQIAARPNKQQKKVALIFFIFYFDCHFIMSSIKATLALRLKPNRFLQYFTANI